MSKIISGVKSKFTLENVIFVVICAVLIVPIIVWLVRKIPGADKALDSIPGSTMAIVGALAVGIALSLAPATHADVETKGGAQYLRSNPRYAVSYTNVANFGKAMTWRLTHPNGTNHIGFDTNGNPTIVNLGTNYTAFTGTVILTNVNSLQQLFFKKGILITTNQVPSAETL